MSDDMKAEEFQGNKEKWSQIIFRTRSPLNLFTLAVLVSTTVFGIAATQMVNENFFNYSIHMFLGLVGFFATIALWSPRALYHPNELRGLEEKDKPADRPLVPTVAAFLGVVLYMAYQLTKRFLF